MQFVAFESRYQFVVAFWFGDIIRDALPCLGESVGSPLRGITNAGGVPRLSGPPQVRADIEPPRDTVLLINVANSFAAPQ